MENREPMFRALHVRGCSVHTILHESTVVPAIDSPTFNASSELHSSLSSKRNQIPTNMSIHVCTDERTGTLIPPLMKCNYASRQNTFKVVEDRAISVD